MIRIRSLASISPQGIYSSFEGKSLWGNEHIATQATSAFDSPVGKLGSEFDDVIKGRKGKSWEKGADRVTQISRLLGRMAVPQFKENGTTMGVIFASSRGAASTLEDSIVGHQEGRRIHPATSPWTTLGSNAAWVARDLGMTGSAIDMSMTCSSGLHALYQAAAFLEAGMEDKMLVGAAEAPLTSFGMAQFESLKVLSKQEGSIHCQPFHSGSGNTMVMSEGGVAMVLECMAEPKNSLATIAAIGIAREDFEHPASISEDGNALRKSMERALLKSGIAKPDVIIPHAPGTLAGDASELAAMRSLFGEDIPVIASPKWKIGHTFGASGLFGLELAIHLLKGGQYNCPYRSDLRTDIGKTPQSVLVNATGFGGNAVSVVLVH